MLIRCSNHRIGYNQTKSANSTALVPLNFASGGFLGQLNFNYQASDGSAQRILSPIFNVDSDSSPQSEAVTWSQGVLAAPTPSPSAVPQTSTSASLLTSSASTASVASSLLSTSKPSSTSASRPGTSANTLTVSAAPSSPSISQSATTSNSHLGAGAIAGIVVGIVVCVGLAAALVFYRRRKPNNVQAEVKTPPIPVHFIAEKDGTRLQPQELSGDGQLVEMATDSHGEMNGFTGRA